MVGTMRGSVWQAKEGVNAGRPTLVVATARLVMAPAPHGLLRRNVFIHAEEIVGIVMRLDGDKTFPAVAISLRHAVIFVAAHEVDIDSGHHRGPQLREQIAYPRDIGGILFRALPVPEQIHNERGAAIAKGCLIGPNTRG